MGIPKNGWFFRENHLKIRMRRPEPSSFRAQELGKTMTSWSALQSPKWAIWVLNFSREKD